MKKRFYAKKQKTYKNSVLLFIFIIVFFMSFSLILKSLSLNVSEEFLIDYILKNNDSELSFEKIISPESLLNYKFNKIDKPEKLVFEENINDAPLVYIYNTHPTEYYAKSTYEVFNITPTVVTASYILKEYLEKNGIYSIVEEKDVSDILKDKSWKYSKSYDASRFLVEDAIKKYDTVEYFIDIHRDAAEKSVTTVDINGESSIRFMFVIGTEHDGYEKNYELASLINNKLIEVNEKFTRGIILKEGEYVDGRYNQDLDENAILIETGAQFNTIDEVNYGMKYLAKALADVIREKENG